MLLHKSEAEPRTSLITTITYECSGILTGFYPIVFKDVGNGPAGPVLAGPLFIKVKTKFHFAKS